MAAITSLNEPDLEDLLAKYELGGLERYWPASNGVENSNYFVRVASQRGPHEVVVTMLERPPNSGALHRAASRRVRRSRIACRTDHSQSKWFAE